MRKSLFVLIFVFVSTLFVSTHVHATQVMAKSLNNMVPDAWAILNAKCVDRQTKQDVDDQGTVLGSRTVYTFQAGEEKDVIKGPYKAGEKFIVELRDGIKGQPSYQEGQEYFLFLTKPSVNTNLSSTLGLSLGSFKVIKMVDGTRTLRGSMINPNLFRDIQKLRPEIVPSLNKSAAALVNNPQVDTKNVSYDDFVSIIKQLNSSNQNVK